MLLLFLIFPPPRDDPPPVLLFLSAYVLPRELLFETSEGLRKIVSKKSLIKEKMDRKKPVMVWRPGRREVITSPLAFR